MTNNTQSTIEIPEPVVDTDFFIIKRIRYELHVEGTMFMTADEECDDFDIDPAKIDLSTPMVVGKTVVGSEERRIDDPTKPFDRAAWVLAKRIELGDAVRPHEKERHRDETTLFSAQGDE